MLCAKWARLWLWEQRSVSYGSGSALQAPSGRKGLGVLGRLILEKRAETPQTVVRRDGEAATSEKQEGNHDGPSRKIVVRPRCTVDDAIRASGGDCAECNSRGRGGHRSLR